MDTSPSTTAPVARLTLGGFSLIVVVIFLPLVGLTLLVTLWGFFKFAGRRFWHRKWGRKMGEEWSLSHRERFEIWFRSSTLGVLWNIWQAVMSVIAFAVYVVGTYYEPSSPVYEALYIVELVLTGLFIIDYGCNFYASANKYFWIWSFYGVVDMVSIAPVLTEAVIRGLYGASAGITFLRALRVFRTLRILRVFKVSKFASTELQKELVQWVLVVICIILMTTVIMQSVMLEEYNNDFTFNTALYFTVVSLSTLGYGDITPKTLLSRSLITVIMALAFPLTAYQTARLIYLRSQYDPKRAGLGRVPQRVHLVVMGSIHFANCLALFREIFHPERQIRNVSVCLLSTMPPDPELEWLLQHPFYRERVTFLIGNAFNPADLWRARADAAQMVMVLGAPFATDVRASDVETVLRYLSVRQALPDVRVSVQLLGWEEIQLVSPFDPVFSVMDYKMGLLALSVRAPGFSTLLSNLMRTDTEPQDMENLSWHTKYLFGAGHELYSCQLSDAFQGCSYFEVVRALYDMFGVVVIGCRRKSHGVTEMLLPHTTTMAGGDSVFVLAQDDLVSRTLHHLKSLPQGDIEQMTPRMHVHRLISTGHIAETIEVLQSGVAVASAPALRLSAGEVPVEEALARNDPGAWRECYALESSSRSSENVIVSHLPADVSGHICVVGPVLAAVRLLLRFRSLKTPSYCKRAIIWMFDQEPPASVLHLMGWLPQVYFLKGGLLSQYDLNRVGLFSKAWSLVLVANPRVATETMSSADAAIADADAICTLQNLFKLASRYSLRVMVCELANGANMRFLNFDTHMRSFALKGDKHEARSVGGTLSFLEMLWSWRSSYAQEKSLTVDELNEKGHINLPLHNSVFYCSGVTFPMGVVTSALANVVWNADIFDIATLLMGGVSLSCAQLRDTGEVFQWQVPLAVVGSTYGILFKLALHIDCVCLGLFRSKSWEIPEPCIDMQAVLIGQGTEFGSSPSLREMLRRFVYTNPPKDEVLKDDDLVYVISRSEQVVMAWNKLKGDLQTGASTHLFPLSMSSIPLVRDNDGASQGWDEVSPHSGFSSTRRVPSPKYWHLGAERNEDSPSEKQKERSSDPWDESVVTL